MAQVHPQAGPSLTAGPTPPPPYPKSRCATAESVQTATATTPMSQPRAPQMIHPHPSTVAQAHCSAGLPQATVLVRSPLALRTPPQPTSTAPAG
ncbi:hypothetical protein NDU88_002708 [Pleurodeles waltl]|uniref:Uncharacterized protein n=1 Tax=Pleurodeles waltl TaxID=8319 RepID=A0AAV7SDN9_PLEWA|nr:hypothetical protein NDU88_002708 [Pleurodeles waltl]